MAINPTPVNLTHDFDGAGGHVAPSSLTAAWKTVIEAGGIAGADDAAITNPATQIIKSTTRIFGKQRGTFIAARMRHKGTGTITSPKLVLFGRNKAQGGAFRRMFNQAEDPASEVELTVNLTTDLVYDGFTYTDVHPKSHTWDCMECNEFIFGVQVAFDASTGSKAEAVVEACCF